MHIVSTYKMNSHKIITRAQTLQRALVDVIQTRLYSNEPNAYNKQRASYKQEVSELRKAWATQRAEQVARRAAAEERDRKKRESAKTARAEEDVAEKEKVKFDLVQKQDEERELRAQAKAERLTRHFRRLAVQQAAIRQQREKLLQQSRNWITTETLDQRIEEAINNPLSDLFQPPQK